MLKIKNKVSSENSLCDSILYWKLTFASANTYYNKNNYKSSYETGNSFRKNYSQCNIKNLAIFFMG